MEEDKKFTAFVLDSLNQTGSNSEICTVMVDDVDFKANKSHLRSCSNFFREVVSTESSIAIKGIKPETYKVVHQALLTGKIALNEANMVDVWFVSSYLEIQFLPEKCEDYIQQNLTKSNYLIVYDDVLAMRSDTICDKIINLIAEDFDRFCLTQWFLDLPKKILMQVIANCKSISPDIIAQAVDQWLNYVPQVQAKIYHDDLDQVGETSETSFVHTFIFNKQSVNKRVTKCDSNSEVRKDSKFKLFLLIMKAKFHHFKNNGVKFFTKIKDDHVLKQKTYKIPNYLAWLYTEKRLDLLSFDHIQPKAKADDEPVIVFLKDKQLIMYNLNTNEFYVHKVSEQVLMKMCTNFEVYDNELYVYIKQNNKLKTFKVLRSESHNLNMQDVKGDPDEDTIYFMAYPFYYRFEYTLQDLTASRFCLESEDSQWTHLDNLSLSALLYYLGYTKYSKFNFKRTYCTNNKIVFLLDDFVLYFDFRQLKLFMQELKQTCSVINCSSSNRYDYLGDGGDLFKTKDSEIDLQFDSLSVFDRGSTFVTGAEFYDNTLYIFTSSNFQRKQIKENLGFEVKIVNPLGTSSKCLFMTVPSHWLNDKI